MAGYSLECALKALIAKQISEHEIPAKSFINEFYVHDLDRLIKLAGIEKDHKNKLQFDADFKVNWGIAQEWTEAARYKQWTEAEANNLYNAINNSKGGILTWLQQYW